MAGMWQVSGGHGYRAQTKPAVEAMKKYVDAGETGDRWPAATESDHGVVGLTP